MRASVDAPNLVVRFGESSWPFQLDLRHGSASIALEESVYHVRPLSWREKTRLARFAHFDEAFVQARFLEACLDWPEACPIEGNDRAVLLALAMWINLPSEDIPVLPLDQKQLAQVTLELCRSLGIGPMAFGELTAPEVEALWHNLARETDQRDSPGVPFRAGSGHGSVRSHSPEQRFDTKIVIIPDDAHKKPPGAQQAIPEVQNPEESRLPRQDVANTQPSVETRDIREVKEPTGSSSGKPAATPRSTKALFRVSFQPRREEIQNAARATVVPQDLNHLTRTSHQEHSLPGPATEASWHAIRSEEQPSTENNAQARPLSFPHLPREIPVHAKGSEEPLTTAPFSLSPPQQAAVAARPATVPAPQPETTAGLDPVRRAEDMEWLLDEFCERLNEAAAGLGIMDDT